MLRWAWERAGYDLDGLAGRIPQLSSWYQGDKRPTLKQVEAFAKATHAPVGYRVLSEPPVERGPIPDLRTMGGGRFDRPPRLLDTRYLCSSAKSVSRLRETIVRRRLASFILPPPATDVEAAAPTAPPLASS
jgi:hypothetical protein